jgi:LysM repeat protein
MNFIAPLWQTARLRWRKQMIMAAGIVAIVAILVGITTTARITASDVNVLANGNFEDGFVQIPGCGTVGQYWSCFTNGGGANYSFYDDQWDPVVANGEHSQLIEINTRGRFDADADRVAGIYQTVSVVPHAHYTLSLKGMLRTTELEGDPWRYRVEVGWVQGVAKDWHQVANWYDVSWDTYYPRTEPGSFSQYTTGLTAASDKVTIFVRILKKWGVPEMELDVNLDGISLTGPAPYAYHPPAPTATPTHGVVYPPVTHPAPTATAAAPVTTCGGPDQVFNGGFEKGFYQTQPGMVGVYWTPFTNGGVANYGFYDDQWDPVVADGQHSQLIEINTKGMSSGDPDRYAGIYQTISGLKAGVTYQLTVKGILRGTGGGDDPYRFEAQWGFAAGRSSRWEHVTNWQGLDFGKIYPRTEPGALATATVQFVAPAPEITLFLRGVKKWGTGETEMDLNLDSISLQSCTTSAPPPLPPGDCIYVVKPGDTLAMIAAKYGVSVHALATANYIANPNYIFVGQVLKIPGCAVTAPPPHPTPVPTVHHPKPTPTPVTGILYYTVKPGDTLSAIAQRYGVDIHHLAKVNGIININHIYIGQVLVIP